MLAGFFRHHAATSAGSAAKSRGRFPPWSRGRRIRRAIRPGRFRVCPRLGLESEASGPCCARSATAHRLSSPGRRGRRFYRKGRYWWAVEQLMEQQTPARRRRKGEEACNLGDENLARNFMVAVALATRQAPLFFRDETGLEPAPMQRLFAPAVPRVRTLCVWAAASGVAQLSRGVSARHWRAEWADRAGMRGRSSNARVWRVACGGGVAADGGISHAGRATAGGCRGPGACGWHSRHRMRLGCLCRTHAWRPAGWRSGQSEAIMAVARSAGVALLHTRGVAAGARGVLHECRIRIVARVCAQLSRAGGAGCFCSGGTGGPALAFR